MLNKKKKTALIEKATESVLGFLITTALSLGLIGGCSYLLFGYKAEIEKIENINAEFKNINEQYNASLRMMDIAKSSQMTSDDITVEVVTIGILKANIENSKLEEIFVQNTNAWCSNKILDLVSGKGAISGFTFKDDDNFNFSKTQSLLITYIDGELTTIEKIKSLVEVWETISANERTMKISEIEKSMLAQAENLKLMSSHSQQMVEQSEIRKGKLDDLKAQGDRAYNTFLLMSILSGLGIISGVFTLYWIIKNFFGKVVSAQKNSKKITQHNTGKKRG